VKKGQGAKNRSTYLEARYGHNAGGIVGLFLAYRSHRKLCELTVKALSELTSRTQLENDVLADWKDKLVKINDDIGFIVQESGASFFEKLSLALKNDAPVYPDESAALEYYAVKKAAGKTVYTKELKDLCAASDKRISEIKKRYSLDLKKNKPGRSKSKSGKKG
jgi:hypothetical protein